MKTILVDAVNTFVIEGEGIWEEMAILLEKYTNPKIIVTNADDNELKKFGLDHMPYQVFTLKHNPEKTDPEYFRALLTKFNLKPAETLYFEHNPSAIRSAESVGIRSYHYDSEVRDLKALQKFLDDNL